MTQALDQLRFTIPEILSLIGLVQCVYLLVYMAFRAGGWRHAAVPFGYFFFLALAFFAGFAGRFLGTLVPGYGFIEWSLWVMGPPLSVLLIIQIARITQPPALRHFWVLGLVPAAWAAASILARAVDGCAAVIGCAAFPDWLTLTGFLAGVISLFAIWSQRALLAELHAQPAGRDRYWLILALVIANLFFLGTVLLGLSSVLAGHDAGVVRTIWGLGLVYLAGTSLFRIYPQAIILVERGNRPAAAPGGDDHKIAERINDLLTLQKVYQEPSYNRVSLAKELGVSETIVSRVINQHFHKTLPQLFNELRIADARRLLLETDAPVKTIAENVGFSSIASFNRVFRETENLTPGEFRRKKGAASS